MPEPAAPRARHPELIAIAVILLACVVLEVVAITVQQAPRPPLTRAALSDVLPGSSSDPALVWTNASPGAEGGLIDLTGKEPVVVAACRDGGAISISLSGRTAITVDCSDPTTAGPLTLGRPGSSASGSIAVETTRGNPRYIVELVAATPDRP